MTGPSGPVIKCLFIVAWLVSVHKREAAIMEDAESSFH